MGSSNLNKKCFLFCNKMPHINPTKQEFDATTKDVTFSREFLFDFNKPQGVSKTPLLNIYGEDSLLDENTGNLVVNVLLTPTSAKLEWGGQSITFTFNPSKRYPSTNFTPSLVQKPDKIESNFDLRDLISYKIIHGIGVTLYPGINPIKLTVECTRIDKEGIKYKYYCRVEDLEFNNIVALESSVSG